MDEVDSACAAAQGGGCAFRSPEGSICDTSSGEEDSPPEETDADALIEGGGCGCAASGSPSVLPLLLLAVVALRRLFPVLLALTLATRALAADAQQFSPADGGLFAGLVEGDLGEPWVARAAITTSYATDLVVLRAGDAEWPLLGSVVTTEVGASLRIDRWMSVGVVVPEHVYVRYRDDPARWLHGDIGLRVAVPLTEEESPIAANWSVQWDSPRNGSPYYLGDTGAVLGKLALDGERGRMRLGGNLAVRLQRPSELPGVPWANRLEYGVAAAYPIGDLSVAAELIGSSPVRGPYTAATLPLEGYLTLRAAPRPTLALRVGLGAGLGHGIGAPAVRAFLGVDLRSRDTRDTDGDGYIDLRDLCDAAPEDFDEHVDFDGCPDPDNDLDGLLDPVDACPDEPEAFNRWKDEDGCPDDLARVSIVVRSRESLQEATVHLQGARVVRVLEGEPLAAEAAPGPRRLQVTAAGHAPYDAEVDLVEGKQVLEVVLEPIRWGQLELSLRSGGQPIVGYATLDEETVGIPVAGARMEVEAGDRTVFVGAPGHVVRYLRLKIPRDGVLATTVDLEPLDVFTESDHIRVRGEVRFALDGVEPTRESSPALEALAAWLLAHPEVELVRVEGYADGLGGSRHNYDLSVRRAEAVRSRLIALGVAPERLVTAGAGEARTETAAGDPGSRKVGLLVLIWDDEGKRRPEAPAP